MTEKNDYNPDYAVHPGEILRDELAEMPRIFVIELPDPIIYQLFLLMAEKRTVYGLEKFLSKLTGTSEEFWSNLQKQYDEWKDGKNDD